MKDPKFDIYGKTLRILLVSHIVASKTRNHWVILPKSGAEKGAYIGTVHKENRLAN